nr:MAG TPA: hypothetical protein [Caudoviricetes sp.]
MGRSSSKRQEDIVEYKKSFFTLAHIGGRTIYSIIAWFVIALDVSPTSFFVSLFLFIFPRRDGLRGIVMDECIDKNCYLH